MFHCFISLISVDSVIIGFVNEHKPITRDCSIVIVFSNVCIVLR